MKISVNLVTWNGVKYAPYLFDSLRTQTFHDFELRILDNGSSDGMVAAIKDELSNFPAPHAFTERGENSGFAGGHNILIRSTLVDAAESTYMLLVNQDIILEPDYLEKLVSFMDEHKDVGAASGRLMKWDFPQLLGGASLAESKTDRVDTLGLRVFKNRRVIDDRSGEVWRHDVAAPFEVFGVSGALPLYRTAAIKDISINGEFFDEDFFSYKEDVDVAWRLRSAGWRAFIVPDAVAYHDRSAAGPETDKDIDVIKNRRRKSSIANFFSYRNHLLTLIKNEYAANYCRDFFRINWYEAKKKLYLLFFEPRTFWIGSWQILKLLPKMWRKRKVVASKRRMAAKEIRKWFV
ncbi:MAG: putative Glycosyl transferase, family 2 [Candidatus Magasanikbacteria bacterium]|nr:putative Glycosyl transferase, family 2 [Candidatus Magasanikbacteria bacterium]